MSSTTAVTGIRSSPPRTFAVCAPIWNDDTTGLPLSLLARSVSGTVVAADAPGALRTVAAIARPRSGVSRAWRCVRGVIMV